MPSPSAGHDIQWVSSDSCIDDHKQHTCRDFTAGVHGLPLCSTAFELLPGAMVCNSQHR